MRTISIKLPDAMLRELAREAESRRVGRSALIRDCLERALHRRGKAKKAVSCLELMDVQAGFFRGPRNLSTDRHLLIEAVANANRSRKHPR